MNLCASATTRLDNKPEEVDNKRRQQYDRKGDHAVNSYAKRKDVVVNQVKRPEKLNTR